MRHLVRLFVVVAAAFPVPPAAAENYPTWPIRLYVCGARRLQPADRPRRPPQLFSKMSFDPLKDDFTTDIAESSFSVDTALAQQHSRQVE